MKTAKTILEDACGYTNREQKIDPDDDITAGEALIAMQTYFDTNKDEWFNEELNRRILANPEFFNQDGSRYAIVNWFTKELLNTKTK